jgi:hypothetical protein
MSNGNSSPFLIARQAKKDADFKRSLAQKIDDKTPSNWVAFDEVEKRYLE